MRLTTSYERHCTKLGGGERNEDSLRHTKMSVPQHDALGSVIEQVSGNYDGRSTLVSEAPNCSDNCRQPQSQQLQVPTEPLSSRRQFQNSEAADSYLLKVLRSLMQRTLTCGAFRLATVFTHGLLAVVQLYRTWNIQPAEWIEVHCSVRCQNVDRCRGRHAIEGPYHSFALLNDRSRRQEVFQERINSTVGICAEFVSNGMGDEI